MEDEKVPQTQQYQGFAHFQKNVDNVDNAGKKSIHNLRKSPKVQKYRHEHFDSGRENKSKNPHCVIDKNQHYSVDNVDNLSPEDGFADFYNVSGPHSYQQVTVHTFF